MHESLWTLPLIQPWTMRARKTVRQPWPCCRKLLGITRILCGILRWLTAWLAQVLALQQDNLGCLVAHDRRVSERRTLTFKNKST